MTSRDLAIHEVGYKSEPWREAIKAEVRDLLRLFKQVCDTQQIPYFIINGTLLGAVKFDPPGQIPWDDDSDIGILASDVYRVVSSLRKNLVSTPYQLVPAFYGYLIYGPRRGMLDLIVFDKHPLDGVYRMSYPLAGGKPSFLMSQVRRYEFTEEELFPLRSYLFEDFVVQGPADGSSVCLRAYGQDVFEVNRRPDKGVGIHPIWPQITKLLNPASQGCADLLAKYCPRLLQKLTTLRTKQ